MRRADWHVFQILTKRDERLAELGAAAALAAERLDGRQRSRTAASSTAPTACATVAAAVRFISAEPLLGPLEGLDLSGIDWLIAGGESGPRHRPMDAEWVRELRDRCVDEDVAFFFKQWGGARPKSGGRELDGRTWDELPGVAARRGDRLSPG